MSSEDQPEPVVRIAEAHVRLEAIRVELRALADRVRATLPPDDGEQACP